MPTTVADLEERINELARRFGLKANFAAFDASEVAVGLAQAIKAGANITLTKSGRFIVIAASGGGGGSALTVQEEDGAPIDVAVSIIRVPNGGLIDNGAGDVSLDYITQAEFDAAAAALVAHLVDALDSHDASAISSVPAGTVAATDVQAAINELATDYAGADATHTALPNAHHTENHKDRHQTGEADGFTVTDELTLKGIATPSVGLDSGSTIPSSLLNVASTTRGVTVFPRMTTAERNAIAAPVEGLCVYNTTTDTLDRYDGAAWAAIGGAGGAPTIHELIFPSPGARIGDLQTYIPIRFNGAAATALSVHVVAKHWGYGKAVLNVYKAPQAVPNYAFASILSTPITVEAGGMTMAGLEYATITPGVIGTSALAADDVIKQEYTESNSAVNMTAVLTVEEV